VCTVAVAVLRNDRANPEGEDSLRDRAMVAGRNQQPEQQSVGNAPFTDAPSGLPDCNQHRTQGEGDGRTTPRRRRPPYNSHPGGRTRSAGRTVAQIFAVIPSCIVQARRLALTSPPDVFASLRNANSGARKPLLSSFHIATGNAATAASENAPRPEQRSVQARIPRWVASATSERAKPKPSHATP